MVSPLAALKKAGIRATTQFPPPDTPADEYPDVILRGRLVLLYVIRDLGFGNYANPERRKHLDRLAARVAKAIRVKKVLIDVMEMK